MAKRKQAAPAKGLPPWMATFSDLMNLLLCFFVLLFSMSSVDAEKFEMVIASLQSSFSVLPAGGSAVGDGQLVSSGISQMKDFSIYFDNNLSNNNSSLEQETEQNVDQAYEKEGLAESEKMSDQINSQISEYGVQSQVSVDFNAQYVLLTLNGALLFDSGKAELRQDALPLIDKVGKIIEAYSNDLIEIEGHTDNVPISNTTFRNNDVLSMFRALTVADYIRDHTGIDPSRIKSAGRGEYVPVADNSTPEGRAKNRRVEIKIYNSHSSQ